MADLDTRSKRASSIQILAPYVLAPLLPDGTISDADRQHIAFTYSGIAAGGAVVPVQETVSQTPAGGRRRRRYILPDGTHVLANDYEIASLLEQFKVVEVVEKPKKSKPRKRVVKTPVVELVSWEMDFAHETFKPVYREKLIFKPDQKKLDLAIQRLKRIIDDEEAILVLLG